MIAFLITAGLGKFFVPLLTKLKCGQTILEIGPSWHGKKQGTPTMGGIMFIIGIICAAAICIPAYYASGALSGIQINENRIIIIKLFAGILMAFCYGLLGLTDDYIKVKRGKNLGLDARQKLIFQFMIAGLFLGMIYLAENFYRGTVNTFVSIPFLGKLNFGSFYWLFAAFVIVGIVNAANLTDGVDGLCASVSLAESTGFVMISGMLSMHGLSILSASMTGGSLGFLVWNFYPAKIFMGDTGSLFMGGLTCALGFAADNITALIICTSVYILEMFSVMFQVIYFKITHGKRLFRMSPIHHHFEIIGYPERKICYVFGTIALIFAFIVIELLYFGKI
jgi:phospho-N-acetylmuramoyl-pentapeptide-transferase